MVVLAVVVVALTQFKTYTPGRVSGVGGGRHRQWPDNYGSMADVLTFELELDIQNPNSPPQSAHL